MTGSKFYDYTSQMNVYELNRFRKYIYSPLYNNDDKLKKFVDAALPFLKTYTAANAEPKKIWAKVFGSVRFNKAKYNRLLSDTVKKIEHFLVVDRFQSQKHLQQVQLLEIMNERKLNKHLPEALSLTDKRLQREPMRNSTYYHILFLLHQQKNNYLENKERRQAEKNLHDVVQSLDTFYLTEKLKYSAAVLHYKNFLKVDAELPMLNEILNYLQQRNDNVPAVEIYRCIILSFIDPRNEDHYTHLKKLVITHAALFPIAEVKSMLVFTMNYCINQINFGKSEYLKEILDLYKYALQHDLLLEGGTLSQWEYKNIVTAALREKDFKWVEKFMTEYKPKLPKQDRNNAYTFNLARYYFSTRKYDQVLQLLQDVKYNDLFYQLDSKTTLLKTYYELGEWLPLYSLKDSFRVLLRRKKLITAAQKENYMNLLKFAVKLFRVDVKDTKTLHTLKAQIEAAVNVADKTWLREKLAELGA